MRRPNNYDNTASYTQSIQLEAGGYVCIVRGIENHTSKTGKQMWKVAVDIADGEFKDYFISQYKRNKQFRADAKYPAGGVSYISLYDNDGNTHRSLKTFCDALEASGASIAWDDRDDVTFASIKGQNVGCLFGREEYRGNDGKTHWSTKARFFLPVDDIIDGNFEVPEDKPLNDYPTSVPPELSAFNEDYVPSGFKAVEDDIPF